MPTPRRPDYTLAVMDKDTGKKLNNAGGAWKNPDGSISISISTCVVISGDRNLGVVLFPANNTPSSPPKQAGKAKKPTVSDWADREDANDLDEIPF